MQRDAELVRLHDQVAEGSHLGTAGLPDANLPVC